jgi:hypothetical protein
MLTCEWCDKKLAPQASGLYQRRFCSDQCRHALHLSCRRYALALLDHNLITVAMLKEVEACQRDRRIETQRAPLRARRAQQASNPADHGTAATAGPGQPGS